MGRSVRCNVILITSIVLFSFLILFIIRTAPFGHSDINPNPPLYRIIIQRAHMVSEGAYFRFWILNNATDAINVTINNADTLTIAPGSSIDYDVVAPQVSLLYRKVTYTFRFSYAKNVENQPHPLHGEMDFTVLVLSSGFVQVFDLIIPILIIITIAVAAIISIAVILRQRRANKKPQP
jgi:hypothetical protein